MTPRGAAFIAQIPTEKPVRVWLDFDFPPDDGHLKFANFPYLPEIVVGPRERVEDLEFDVLRGRDVELVVHSRGKRYEVLRDRIAVVEPLTLVSISFDPNEEPMREHVTVD